MPRPRVWRLAVPWILLLTAATARGQNDCFDYATAGWEIAGTATVTDPVADMTRTDDGRLLAATPRGVVVYGLSAAAQPAPTIFLPTESPVLEVATDGDLVAALTDDGHLHVGVLGGTDHAAWSGQLVLNAASLLAVADGLAVFRQGDHRLATVDLSDPKDPRYLGWSDMPDGFSGLEVQAGLAFMAANSRLLMVASLADPAVPAWISSANRIATGTAVAVEFPRVHVANVFRIYTYDASDPADLVSLGRTVRLPGFIERLAADRGRCVAATQAGHLYNLVSTPDAFLDPVGSAALAEPATSLAIVDEHVYVVAPNADLRALDLGAGRHPVATRARPEYVPNLIEARGDRVFLLESDHPVLPRLTIARHDGGADFVPLGAIPLGGDARGLDVRGDWLVYATISTSLGLVDVSDPAAPIIAGNYSHNHVSRDVALVDGAACALGRDGTGDEVLAVHDFSAPPNLPLSGALRVPYGARQLVAWRDHVLVRLIFDLNGVLLVDLGDPSTPRAADWISIRDRCVDLAADGHHAYVLTDMGEVHVIDLQNTSALTVVATVDLGEGAGGGTLAIQGNNLLVTDETRGVSIIDVADPEMAYLAGAAWVPVTGRVVATANGVFANDTLNLQQVFLPSICGALADGPPSVPAPATVWASPNPFNPRTEVVFSLPAASTVDLAVYDVAGRLVRNLVRGQAYDAGPQSVPWDGLTETGRSAAAGVYLVRLRSAAGVATNKLALVR